MLRSLSVSNIALIENMTMDFHTGLHVVSGASGSGKSLVVDAVNLVLGGRSDKDLIRNGTEKASVEAVFMTGGRENVSFFLKEQGIDENGDGSLVLFREITVSGRSISRINGVLVNISTVKQLAEYLMDVHGQHEHQKLGSEDAQLFFLDQTGDTEHRALVMKTAEKASEFLNNHRMYANLIRKQEQTKERRNRIHEDLELLRKLKLKPGEDVQLAKDIAELKYYQRRKDAVMQTCQLLSHTENGESPVESIKTGLQTLHTIADMNDNDISQLYRRFENCYFELEEIVYEISRLSGKMDSEPDKLEQYEKRLDTIRKAERHFGKSTEEILSAAEELEKELAELDAVDELITATGKEHKQLLREYREAAAELTASRRALAERFGALVCRELKTLDMGGTEFSVTFDEQTSGKPKLPSVNGDDKIEFMISPNPGEPKKPLAKIASGGELSRIMLAITCIGSKDYDVSTMVFDEIDTGISGHTAQKVAEKMRQISDSRQVICVTHLPQIAAAADHQYLISKQSSEEKTFTKAMELDREGRISELASMIQGADNRKAAEQYAREMLDSYVKDC